MKPDPLEQRLAEIPVPELPCEWKRSVLAQARAKRQGPFFWQINWPNLLWPHPWAWATLAVIWLMIAGLNVSGPKGEALYAITPGKGNAAEFSPLRYAVYLHLRNRMLAAAADNPETFYSIQPTPKL